MKKQIQKVVSVFTNPIKAVVLKWIQAEIQDSRQLMLEIARDEASVLVGRLQDRVYEMFEDDSKMLNSIESRLEVVENNYDQLPDLGEMEDSIDNLERDLMDLSSDFEYKVEDFDSFGESLRDVEDSINELRKSIDSLSDDLESLEDSSSSEKSLRIPEEGDIENYDSFSSDLIDTMEIVDKMSKKLNRVYKALQGLSYDLEGSEDQI